MTKKFLNLLTPNQTITVTGHATRRLEDRKSELKMNEKQSSRYRGYLSLRIETVRFAQRSIFTSKDYLFGLFWNTAWMLVDDTKFERINSFNTYLILYLKNPLIKLNIFRRTFDDFALPFGNQEQLSFGSGIYRWYNWTFQY